MLWEEFVKVVTKSYFISINHNIVKMPTRKASNSVLIIDHVMNDVNSLLKKIVIWIK